MNSLGNPTLVIGLLQVQAEPWKSIHEKGQVPTWIKTCPKEIEIINLYGKTPSKFIRNLDLLHEKLRWSPTLQGPIHILDRFLTKFLSRLDNADWKIESNNNIKNLIVNVASTNLTLPNVEIALFNYFIKNTNADFLYMSNTSSYVNIQKLNKLLKELPKNNIYGGTMMNFAGINFASGANRILSRDTVKFIIENFRDWDFQYLDDVSMGKLLEQKNFLNVEIPSIEFRNIKEIESTDLSNIKSIIHFRLKSGNQKSRKDVDLMNHVHKKLTNN